MLRITVAEPGQTRYENPANAIVAPHATVTVRGERVDGVQALGRGAGAVDRGGLENRCTRKGTEGSNPSLSANDNI